MTPAAIRDFRDPERDRTAGFSIADDGDLASLLAYAFPRVSTFRAFLKFYEYIRDETAPGSRHTPAEVDALIDRGLFPEEPATQAETIHGFAILDKIRQYAADAGLRMPKRGVALENGAGCGEFIPGLANYFRRVVVVDFSMSFLTLAMKLAEECRVGNVEFICANVERLPLDTGSIDFIHSNNVIEHVTDKEAMFREANRVLAPGGMLFVLSPNRFTIWTEPHFGLPCYGFIPPPLQRLYVARRFNRSSDEVTSVSLWGLKGLTSSFGTVAISFIPRGLRRTVTGGVIRGTLTKALSLPMAGRLTDFLVNRLLLPVMPYHVALCHKDTRAAKRAAIREFTRQNESGSSRDLRDLSRPMDRW